MKYDFNADLRKVYQRLAMSDERIELTSTPSGSLVLYCGRCKQDTYQGQLACCQWAVQMVDKYFSTGDQHVAASPLLLSNGE